MSPCNVTLELHIKEMITNSRSFLLSNNFSKSAPKEMYREQYGEYTYWLWVVKSKGTSYITVNLLQVVSYSAL